MRAAFAEMARRAGDGRAPEAVADGFITIAVENMANAIKKISVERGYDVTRYALNCFGGAGGAARLQGRRQSRHDDGAGASAVLAPLGLRHGARRHPREPATGGRAALRTRHARARRNRERLGEETEAEVAGQGVDRDAIETHVRAHLRYAGTDTALEVDQGSPLAMRQAFERAHKARFGFIDEGKALVLEAVSVESVGGGARFVEPELPAAGTPLPEPATTTRLYTDGRWHDAPVHLRERLGVGHVVAGPALLIEPHQTIVVEPGWSLEITAKNHVVLRRVVAKARGLAAGTNRRPRHARGVQQTCSCRSPSRWA